MMEHSFTINLGYHVNMDVGAPIGEQEIGNHSDPCAVAVNGATLGATASGVSGHVSRFIT